MILTLHNIQYTDIVLSYQGTGGLTPLPSFTQMVYIFIYFRP